MDYHFDPQQALEELNEEALLPNPVFVRDMILRAKLAADAALELNREFQTYLAHFGETQRLGRHLLTRLVEFTAPAKH
jgi:hypothetical protein